MVRDKWIALAFVASLALACGQQEAQQVAEPASEPTAAAPAESATQAATAPAADAAAPPEAEIDAATLAIVKRAGDFLRGQQSFSVTLETSYDTVQEDGEKLESGALRRMHLQRPDRIRTEVMPRTGGTRITTFDGKLLSVLDIEQKAYAQVERAGTLDSTIDFIRDDLGIPLPLSELWRSEPSRDLTADLKAAYRVDTEWIDGVACDQVFLSNEKVDGQFWIAEDGDPVIHRVVLTYREEGQPQLRASFRDWNFAPTLTDGGFSFTAPEGAERIQFAARPRPTAPEGQ